MRTKRLIATATATLILATGAMSVLSGCKKPGDAIGNFDDYEFEYNQTTLKAPHDADMTLDGELSEPRWANSALRWQENYDQESEVYFKYTMFFTDYGLYLAAVSEDWHVFYNKPYAQSENTGFDVYIAREGDYSLNDRVWITFNCGNTFWSHGLNSYEGRVTVQGGEYNTGDSTGITLEAFIPWSQFGYKEAPERMRSVCAYRLVSSASATSGKQVLPGYSNGNNYGKYFDFGKDGYESADSDVGILGDSKSGYAKGPDWDVSDAKDDIYRSNKGKQNTKTVGQSYLFYRDVMSDTYTVSATLTPNLREDGLCGINSTDPRAGLMTGYNAVCFSAFMVSFSAANLNANTLELTSSFTQGGTTTHKTVYKSAPGAVNISEGVTLTCAKYGASFFYFLGEGDDIELIYSEEINLLAGDSQPGIQITNCDVTISAPSASYYKGARSELVPYLNAADVYVISTENSAGGAVTTDVSSVKGGDSLTLNILPTNGFYQLDKLEIAYGNGGYNDITSAVRSGMKEGKYTLENIRNNVALRSSFRRLSTEDVTFLSGTVTLGQDAVANAVVKAEGITDKSMYYTSTTSLSGLYSMRLPAGTYKVTVWAPGCQKMIAESVAVAGEGKTLDVALSLGLLGGNITVNGTLLTSSITRCTFSEDDSSQVVYAQSGSDAEVAWISGLGAVNGDFTVTALYEYAGGSDADPSGGFIIGNGTDKYALFALGTHEASASYRTGFRVYNTSAFANRWQTRPTTQNKPISFTTLTKVIITLTRRGDAYTLYSDIYVDGMTEATTLRGSIEGGRATNVTTGTGKITVPAGNVGVGVSFRNNSACVITVLNAEKN